MGGSVWEEGSVKVLSLSDKSTQIRHLDRGKMDTIRLSPMPAIWHTDSKSHVYDRSGSELAVFVGNSWPATIDSLAPNDRPQDARIAGLLGGDG